MATVAESLFGVTPESLQQERQNALLNRGIQLAQLDPFQQAYANIYAGAGNVGRGVGGLLGVEDPELMRVRQRQQLLQGLDPNDAKALRAKATELLNAGDYPAASQLSQRALDIEVKQAGIAKDTAAAQASTVTAAAGRLTPEQRNAAGIADTKATPGTPEWTKTYNEELVRLTTKPESRINYGEEANRVAVAAFGKPFAELTQEQARQVDQTLEKRGITKAQAGRSNISTELKIPPNIADAINALENVSKPEVELLTYAQQSKDLINEAVRTKNSQAWESARTVYAKALGQGKLSNEDIQRTGVDPRLIQGALDWINKKISGIPNEDIMKQLYIVSSILEQNASKRYDEKALRARASAANTGFKGDLDLYFPTSSTRFGVKSTQSSGAAGTAGSSNVVDWSTMGQKK